MTKRNQNEEHRAMNNPSLIGKLFDSIKQAEAYQNRLYGRYDHVRLVHSPMFGESGQYVWEVR